MDQERSAVKIALKASPVFTKNTEQPHPFRTVFMRDRDRILYSRAFRRLSGKTQVFLSGYKEHTRTRLTHTLEVAQIARTISRQLCLDEDLTEAIALGHDLGHTPFGHVGERTLNQVLNGCDDFTSGLIADCEKGFKHNLQSVRIVTDLEPSLNLTNYLLFGLSDHTDLLWNKCGLKNGSQCSKSIKEVVCEPNELRTNFYDRYKKHMDIYLDGKQTEGKQAWSLEAFVVRMSDEIAQRHHDLEDALEGSLITIPLAKKMIVNYFEELAESMDQYSYDIYLKVKDFTSKDNTDNMFYFLKTISRFVVNFLTDQVIKKSIYNINWFIHRNTLSGYNQFLEIYPEIDCNDAKQIISYQRVDCAEDIKLQGILKSFEKELRDIMLKSYPVQRMDGKGQYIIRKLCKAYLTNPQQLPDKTIITLFHMYEPDRFSSRNEIEGSEVAELVGSLRKNISDSINDQVFKVCLIRVICDYISGMTDAYALKEYNELYG